MTNKEKKYLDYIDERVYHCLQQGIDKKQIAEWLDDVIYDLSDDNSSELFNKIEANSEKEAVEKLKKKKF